MTTDDLKGKIADINRSSASSDSMVIFEIGTLDQLIDTDVAEEIRTLYVKNNTEIKQISNLTKFENWTKSPDITQNVDIKYVPESVFKIDTEIIVFDSIVALYRLDPKPYYHEVNDKSFADMMRSLFDSMWQIGSNLLLSANGSSLTKQYLPISAEYRDVPLVIYPAKDDGRIEDIFDRSEPGCLEGYLDSILATNWPLFKDADMIIAVVWGNEGKEHCDVWKLNRNTLSDDSGFLYDVHIFAGTKKVTNMGAASGNTSIVITAEEMQLRELVLVKGLSIKEAADRSKYQARFPAGFLPEESFYN